MDFSFLTVLLPMLFRGLKVTLMIAGVGITLGFIIGCLSGYALHVPQQDCKNYRQCIYLDHPRYAADCAGLIYLLCHS